MPRLLLRADAVLRGELGSFAGLTQGRSLLVLASLVCVFGSFYGAMMGTFGGLMGDRALQVLYSALKVPLLLFVTFVLALPSFFIFNTLFGLRPDFPTALRALVASQAGLTIVLASLAPFTLLWNVSTTAHGQAVLFNAAMFWVAATRGQFLLRRYYRELLERDVRHKTMLRLWGVLYAFVGIQMAWILRPFVGDPHLPVSFFREDTWGNAYIILTQLIRKTLF